MATEHDVIGAGGVRLRVLDHGGDGPAILCTHGAGANLRTLDAVARRLEGRARFVAYDTRGHGQSDVSEDFTPPALVGDVEAIIAALDLSNPVVAGHSLGGMIAAFYGEAHPECTAAINIDGHGRGGPSVPASVREELVRLSEAAAATPPASSGDDAWYEGQVDMMRLATEAGGGRWDRVEPTVRGGFVHADGAWHRRPSFAWMQDVMHAEIGDWDLFSLYRRVECPLTIFNCTAQEAVPGVPIELMAAMREGLAIDLAALVDERANVTVVEVDSTHQGAVFAAATRTAEILLAATSRQ